MDALFIDERQVTDGTGKVVAAVFEVSTPEELQMLKIENEQTENIVLGLLDWKVSSNTLTMLYLLITQSVLFCSQSQQRI